MKRLMMTVVAAVVLLSGSVLSVSADHYRRYSERQVREIGFLNGYEMGYQEGQRDLRAGFSFDYKQNRAYKNGMVGYRDEYYHDGNYKKGFRNGFEEGYRDSYNRRRRAYNSGWGWWGNGGSRNDRYNDRYDRDDDYYDRDRGGRRRN